MLQRRAEEHFARKKEHNKFGRGLELVPIGFASQGRHVCSDLGGMLSQFDKAYRLFLRFDGFKVGGQGRLRVHDHVLACGQANNQIGPQPAVICGDTRLLGEVTILQHACQFHDAFELDFPPASADLRRPQGFDEIRCLAA